MDVPILIYREHNFLNIFPHNTPNEQLVRATAIDPHVTVTVRTRPTGFGKCYVRLYEMMPREARRKMLRTLIRDDAA